MRRAGQLSDGREDEALRDEAAREEASREEGQGEDVLALYLEDLKQIPALEAEEEERLVAQLRAKPEDSQKTSHRSVSRDSARGNSPLSRQNGCRRADRCRESRADRSPLR